MYKLLAVLLLVGLSTQHPFHLFGDVQDVCTNAKPTISAACEAAVQKNQATLNTCAMAEIAKIEAKVKTETDQKAIVKDICCGLDSMVHCLDSVKDACSADDITKIKDFAHGCAQSMAKDVDLSCKAVTC